MRIYACTYCINVDRNRQTAVCAPLPVCIRDMSFTDSDGGGVGGHARTDQG